MQEPAIKFEQLFPHSEEGQPPGMEYLVGDYYYAGGKKEGKLEPYIYIKKGSRNSPSEEIIEQLQNDVIRGIALSQMIDSRCPTSQALQIRPDERGYFCNESLMVSAHFIEASSKSRSAGILHEELHNLEEDYHFVWDNNMEALSQLAEFLFTGDDRLEHFYRLYVNSFSEDCSDPHATAWRSIRLVLGDEESDENYEQRYQALFDKTKKMTEEEKSA